MTNHHDGAALKLTRTHREVRVCGPTANARSACRMLHTAGGHCKKRSDPDTLLRRRRQMDGKLLSQARATHQCCFSLPPPRRRSDDETRPAPARSRLDLGATSAPTGTVAAAASSNAAARVRATRPYMFCIVRADMLQSSGRGDKQPRRRPAKALTTVRLRYHLPTLDQPPCVEMRRRPCTPPAKPRARKSSGAAGRR